MVSDYTARVERLHIGSDPSQLIAAVSNYIQRQLSEPITTEQIAASLYISRTHLSARFHRETGITLSDLYPERKNRGGKAPSPLYRQIPYGDFRLSRLLIAESFFKNLPQICRHHPRRIPRKARRTLKSFSLPRPPSRVVPTKIETRFLCPRHRSLLLCEMS